MAQVNLLSTEAQAKLGATHEVIITHADLDTAAATETTEVTVIIPAGSLVKGGHHVLVTEFDSPSSTSLVYSAGDAGDDDVFLTNTEIDTAHASTILYKVATNTSIPHGEVYAAADTLIFNFTATGDNLEDFTVGEIHYYFTLLNLKDSNN